MSEERTAAAEVSAPAVEPTAPPTEAVQATDPAQAAMVADRGFGLLKAPVKRVAVPNVCIPYAPNAEARVIPNAESIARTCRELTGRAAAA